MKKKKRNNGEGGAVGNALRFLVKQGKTAAEPLLDVLASVTGVEGLNRLGKLISGSKELSEADKEILLKEMEYDLVEMQETTKRLSMDNEHIITRLVRPVIYGCMFLMFLMCVFFDGNLGDFTIDKAYVPVIQSLFGNMTMFYYGSRGIEKIAKIYKGY